MSFCPTSSRRWRLAQRLEAYWWKRYLRGKNPADYLADKRAYWQRELARLGWKTTPGRRVLDAGCGPAGIFIHLAETENVTALDPLLDRYEAQLTIFDRADHPEVDFIHQPLEQPIAGPPFSAIYCFNAINHVADWDRALDVLTAAAAPGCRLILTSDVHRFGWLLPVFRVLPGDLLHPQQHRAEAYREALTARGWRIEREVLLKADGLFNYVGWVAVRSRRAPEPTKNIRRKEPSLP